MTACSAKLQFKADSDDNKKQQENIPARGRNSEEGQKNAL